MSDEIVARLLEWLRASPFPDDLAAADLIERQAARIAELERAISDLLAVIDDPVTADF